jgi:serine/threonine protein phosphatase PrpC
MRTDEVDLRAYGCTDVGKVRKNNEDAFVIADLGASAPIHAMSRPVGMAVGPHGVLLAVSDGMGGAQAGEVASALALHSLRGTRRPARVGEEWVRR